ncbi:MAG: hydrogenase formation protein HypD, partial [Spirochaetaceae bacterium]
TMPEALMALLDSKEVKIDGFILPGHVTAITGTQVYRLAVQKYPIPCVVSGFEPTDMLASIEMLVRQIKDLRSEIEIQYTRSVKPEGNPVAKKVMAEVFKPVDAFWRGLGKIPESGLAIREIFEKYDAFQKFNLPEIMAIEPAGCRCGDVMRGSVLPEECALFGKACSPENPVGACMVSSEGACGIHYRYQTLRNP